MTGEARKIQKDFYAFAEISERDVAQMDRGKKGLSTRERSGSGERWCVFSIPSVIRNFDRRPSSVQLLIAFAMSFVKC